MILAALATLLTGGLASAQIGPDITVLKLGGEANDFQYYGQYGGIAAYSMGTTSCNPGDVPVQWTSSDHPVIGQNFFRLKDGRFEMLGQSWLKHGFCAVNEGGCGTCQSTPCDTLGIGCADTYWATLNDGAGGGPKWQINSTNGQHPHPYPSPSGPAAIRGRLQVAVSDIDPAQNPGAVYFAEGQYISAHDASFGNSGNNSSWRKLNVVSVSNIQGGGSTHVTEPAVFAWRSEDPAVRVSLAVNTDEGGPGIHGRYWFASRSHSLGNGMWRYVYAIENLTSEQSGGSFTVPIPSGTNVSNPYFHDVDYHSGEPYNGLDWAFSQTDTTVSWTCPETYNQNPNANALRWGTMWSFGFDCDSAPQQVSAEIALFEPGPGSVLGAVAEGPGGIPPAGTGYCFGDGSGTFCPCLNFGWTGRGCENGTYNQGCWLTGQGVPSVSADSVVLFTDRAAPNEPGLFFQGDQQTNAGDGLVFGDGLRCASQNVVRLQVVNSDSGGDAQTSVSLGAAGGVIPGDIARYQFWYRDPLASACGFLFNTSNGLEITWVP